MRRSPRRRPPIRPWPLHLPSRSQASQLALRYAQVEEECQHLELLHRQSKLSASTPLFSPMAPRDTEEDFRSTRQTLEPELAGWSFCRPHRRLNKQRLEELAEAIEAQHRELDAERVQLQTQQAKLVADKAAYLDLLARLEAERKALQEREASLVRH